ncbi:hypothetical protein GCM10020221_19040 [Streptomyces thioluteus]|uniref:Uncharacterized protein n=1 Tax=Streptomyces thioluteus TaxID=66431 RepID=A0ABN3WQ58_STRTU
MKGEPGGEVERLRNGRGGWKWRGPIRGRGGKGEDRFNRQPSRLTAIARLGFPGGRRNGLQKVEGGEKAPPAIGPAGGFEVGWFRRESVNAWSTHHDDGGRICHFIPTAPNGDVPDALLFR